jgi:mannose-1-phosphate guanylyltransferase/mannose-1-phosphate guanylyltransferase/mannose-6-phosphate isomerase
MPEAKPIIPVILSGGSGTRLWPLSRPDQPKQLLPLTADETMLQLTARRTAGERFARPIVVANAFHADQVEEQLADVATEPQALVLEPMGRNTAPAIALAAITAGGGSDPILVMPSDHVIADVEAFHAAIHAALPLVHEGWLVTFGIPPDAPETGYGWIKVGEQIAEGVHRVDRFVEKPPRDKAEAMLASGDHAWNGGIFLFRADMYLGALSVYAPAMLVAAQRAMEKARREGNRIWPDADEFARLCGDGEGAARRRGAGRDGMERCRLVGRAARDQCVRRTGQCLPRRRRRDRRGELSDTQRGGQARGAGGRARPDRGGRGRRHPRAAARTQPGRPEDHRGDEAVTRK